jgi:hypothetical protein
MSNLLSFKSGIGSNIIPNSESLGNATESTLIKFDENLSTDNAYQEKFGGAAPGPGDTGIPVLGTDSLFSPFYIFRYAKFGSSDGKTYDPSLHRNINTLSVSNLSGVKDSSKLFAIDKENVENPTASQIIDWAKSNGEVGNESTIIGPTPYQANDFLWCKYYGKIPNNRLLTLRRFPIPIEDNLQIATEKMPLIPTAQAITWWGGDTGNSLSSVLGITYGFKWTPDDFGEVQNINGNEVEASKLLDRLGFEKGKGDGADLLRKGLLATLFDNPSNPHAGSGWDAEAQKWIKESYSLEGAYWNRVLGPVNVITQSQRRQRGYDFTHPIELKFTYSLRAYSKVNPKIAFLDLITNFLSLTYNNAEFWGGATRYFQKTGYILPGLDTTKFEKGDYIGGIEDGVRSMVASISNKLKNVNKFIEQLMSKSGGLNAEEAKKLVGETLENASKSNVANNIAGSLVKSLMQVPLQMRSFLDGRAVGEWHLTVGNPMNPLATIGNLCMKSTSISFSESLGLDDFPTEVTFKVTLIPGRHRAKQDIESMFNLGGGPMSFTALPDPSSAKNTNGESAKSKQSTFNINTKDLVSDKSSQQNPGSNSNTGISDQISKSGSNGQTISGDFSVGKNVSLSEATNLANYYRSKVERAYGKGFADSPILVDYFLDLKLKD